MNRDDEMNDATRRLIKIAMWEGLVLILVVGAYLMTDSFLVLILGLVASTTLFAPMFLRWAKDNQSAKAQRQREGGDG